MAHHPRGTARPLSPARKMKIEMLRHARRVPSLPIARKINMADVVAARQPIVSAPSWNAVFLRAYGLLCLRRPVLRQALIPWPWPHLYEHPHSVSTLLVEREWQGETVVLGAKLRAPENMSLAAITRQLQRLKTAPVLDISEFRQTLRIGRLPSLLRRFTFWHSLYLSGATRAKRMGTCMVSSFGHLGAEQMHPLTFHTTYFTFGPISPAGDVVLKIVYDHRVLDGAEVGRCLKELDQILHAEILSELHLLRREAA